MKRPNKDIKTRKTCHRCKKDQDILCFNKDSKSKDGFKASCKKCISSYNKKYTFKNRIKLREQTKQWREQNKEHADSYMLNYQEKNKDKNKEYLKLYREKNKDILSQQFECECGGTYLQRHK